MHPASRSRIHVLLVEEDDDVRDVYTELFVHHGYTVSAARGAREALEYAMLAPEAIFSSLVFRDMSGFDLCRRLRAMPQTAKSFIVALTGYSETGIHKTTKDAGFDAYQLKPITGQSLMKLLSHVQDSSVLKLSS